MHNLEPLAKSKAGQQEAFDFDDGSLLDIQAPSQVFEDRDEASESFSMKTRKFRELQFLRGKLYDLVTLNLVEMNLRNQHQKQVTHSQDHHHSQDSPDPFEADNDVSTPQQVRSLKAEADFDPKILKLKDEQSSHNSLESKVNCYICDFGYKFTLGATESRN